MKLEALCHEEGRGQHKGTPKNYTFRGYKIPISFARTTALVRLLTFNLLLMFLVWVFTVFKEMKSFSAISLFDNPAAMRCKTSNSRSLNGSNRPLIFGGLMALKATIIFLTYDREKPALASSWSRFLTAIISSNNSATALIIGIVAGIFTIIGLQLGKKISSAFRLSLYAEAGGGIILVAIGANILYEHGALFI